jgi:hypothetical protein
VLEGPLQVRGVPAEPIRTPSYWLDKSLLHSGQSFGRTTEPVRGGRIRVLRAAAEPPRSPDPTLTLRRTPTWCCASPCRSPYRLDLISESDGGYHALLTLDHIETPPPAPHRKETSS